MSLLKEIQSAILGASPNLYEILLKLRYLASKLGSAPLEDWVRYEIEGYPEAALVPSFRIAEATYLGTFTNGYRTLTNAQIPSHVVRKHAGESWVSFPIRDSIAVVDSTLKSTSPTERANFGPECANLLLMLKGKVYEDYQMTYVAGRFGGMPFDTIHSNVRAKVLDLTLELEKEIPVAALITIENSNQKINETEIRQTTNITNNIIYGNNGIISDIANRTEINFSEGNDQAFLKWLIETGIPSQDAQELVKLAKSETPDSLEKPFGTKVGEWLASKAKKGANLVWAVGKDVGKELIIAGLKRFYGLE